MSSLCGITALKLQQTTVGVFLFIGTGFFLIGDVNTTDQSDSCRNKPVVFESGLWETEVLNFHKLSRVRLSVEVKHAVKF